jgi:hypothetical protein
MANLSTQKKNKFYPGKETNYKHNSKLSLDSYKSELQFVYGLEKILTYNGKAIEVIRSSDSATQEFDFTRKKYTNLAKSATITGSGGGISNGSYTIDGSSSTFGGLDANLQSVVFDLGASYNISKINLWHYVNRTYYDVIVQISNVSNFSSGVTTIFNNDSDNSASQGVGTDIEYLDTTLGKTIECNVNGRYVRFFSNGSNINGYNHYTEVQILTKTNDWFVPIDDILTFCNGSSGYISGYYDQKTGVKTTISTSGQRQQIVDNGIWTYLNTTKYLLEIPQNTTLTMTGLSCTNRANNLLCMNYIGFKGSKTISGYSQDYVFPINCSAGLMDFGWTNLSNIYWYLAGGSSSTNARPGATLDAGVSYSFGTNMVANNITLNCYNTGVRYIGDLKDFPRLKYILVIDDLVNITGDIIDAPKVSLNFSGWHARYINGDFANAPITSYSFQIPYSNISGVYHASNTSIYIILNNTLMTSNDTDQTLIYLAANTTIVSGGVLYIKANRTFASDAAVASLTGKFTITEV